MDSYTHTYRQAHTGEHSHRQRGMHTNGQIDMCIDRHMERQINTLGQPYRQKDRWKTQKEIHTD